MTDALVVGGPSVLAAWAHALVREAAALANPPLEIRALDRQDDAEFLGTADSGPDRLFISSFPSVSLIAKVAAGQVPTLALLDEPADCIRFFKQQSNWPMTEVLRAQTLAHTIDRALYDNSSVLTVHRGMDIEATELIDAILECLQIRLSGPALSGLKERHTRNGQAKRLEDVLKVNVSEWAPLEDLPNLLSQEDASLVAQALAPLLHFAFEERPPRVIWPQKLFMFGDKPSEPPPVVIEVTGGARTILFGPYLFLPPGRYRVSFVIGFSEDASGVPFMVMAVQQLGQTTIARARWTSPAGGIFEGSFEMTHVLSNEAIEIILRSDEGAIEGRMAMVQISFDLLSEEDERFEPDLLTASP